LAIRIFSASFFCRWLNRHIGLSWPISLSSVSDEILIVISFLEFLFFPLKATRSFKWMIDYLNKYCKSSPITIARHIRLTDFIVSLFHYRSPGHDAIFITFIYEDKYQMLYSDNNQFSQPIYWWDEKFCERIFGNSFFLFPLFTSEKICFSSIFLYAYM